MTPSTDPDMQNYCIRLLPWVTTHGARETKNDNAIHSYPSLLPDVSAQARWACLAGSESGTCYA